MLYNFDDLRVEFHVTDFCCVGEAKKNMIISELTDFDNVRFGSNNHSIMAS